MDLGGGWWSGRGEGLVLHLLGVTLHLMNQIYFCEPSCQELPYPLMIFLELINLLQIFAMLNILMICEERACSANNLFYFIWMVILDQVCWGRLKLWPWLYFHAKRGGGRTTSSRIEPVFVCFYLSFFVLIIMGYSQE